MSRHIVMQIALQDISQPADIRGTTKVQRLRQAVDG
jgi:hypothetical protein